MGIARPTTVRVHLDLTEAVHAEHTRASGQPSQKDLEVKGATSGQRGLKRVTRPETGSQETALTAGLAVDHADGLADGEGHARQRAGARILGRHGKPDIASEIS